jgi:predicted RNA binding protein YcfA (HicA-like mRNA interferase family)
MADDGGEMSSLENRGFRFLATLGGHVQLHHAGKVRKLHAVGRIPSSVQSGAMIPTSK